MEAYNPPTAKLAFHSDKSYHVFLSFRGSDVRKTLVDHLYQALSAAGLNVFIDSEKLKKGEIIDLSLERAIESSAIRIPVFSRGYAASAWCLKEAAAMLMSPGLIIPLFYHVHPTHVRYPLSEPSPYNQSFLKHYSHSDRYRREEVERWKNALEEICKRSGWSMDLTEGYEARLVKIVVNDLIKTLDKVPLEVAEHPVGIDSVTNPLIQKFNLNSMKGIFKLGIWGIGGIGKTTVAKAVYNQVYATFEAASFVANVRATAREVTGLTKLQKQILKDLTNYVGQVHSIDEGKSLFRDRLGGRRILLVLDDVDSVEQLKALVGDWLAMGSRVIITSRDQHILNVAQADTIHEMSGLGIDQGLQLFSWHAFLRASPCQNLQDLSKRIVEACKGHPLSLEVIGSFLYDKQDNRDCWEEALDNITSNQDIYDRLYISYSALTDDEKEIFVDIACFFIGEQQKFPIIFWKSLYGKVNTALCNLSMKLLIKIDIWGAFSMHDHLRDMGRTIAEREKEGTRLWEDVNSSIMSNKITRLQLIGGNPQRLESLYKHTLRYLCLQNMDIEGMTRDTLAMLPPSLIWLRIENCQFATGMNKIKKKRLHSRFVGNIWQMKIVQITRCDVDIHHISSLFSLPNIKLQHLDLSTCWNLYNLPDSIGNLSQLQYLDLSYCNNLNNLPDIIGNLSQLQYLDLRGCENLNNLPDTLGNLSQLQQLNLRGCENLNNLSDTIGNLSQLQNLNVSRCENLIDLPNSIGNLSQLHHYFDLSSCENLNNLPDTIGNLSQFQHLNLSGCRRLNSIPCTIGNLSQLQHLNLSRCVSLNELPATIGNLLQLQYLDLSGCVNLKELPATIGNLSQLQSLNLGWCENLNEINATIGSLLQLKHLHLNSCSNLKSLPDTIGNLSQLQNLDLDWCENLNSIPQTIGNLSQLQNLDLSLCGKFC